jgi:hypothetical protein
MYGNLQLLFFMQLPWKKCSFLIQYIENKQKLQKFCIKLNTSHVIIEQYEQNYRSSLFILDRSDSAKKSSHVTVPLSTSWDENCNSACHFSVFPVPLIPIRFLITNSCSGYSKPKLWLWSWIPMPNSPCQLPCLPAYTLSILTQIGQIYGEFCPTSGIPCPPPPTIIPSYLFSLRQRVLNFLPSMIWLLTHLLPPLPSVSSTGDTGRLRKRDKLLTGEGVGGGRGAKSYDRKESLHGPL